LYQIASNIQEGNILEIGTGAGFSTVVLAANAPLQIVHTIDPEEPYDVEDNKPPEERVTEKVWEKRCIIRKQMWDELKLKNIEFHQTKAEEFELSGESLGLLFIDGKHTRPHPFNDFEEFHENVVVGGYIIFHDYGKPEDGVKDEVERIQKELPEIWVCMKQEFCDSLAIFRKIAKLISKKQALNELCRIGESGFHVESRVEKAIKQAETLYDGVLETRQEFLHLIWHEVDPSRILTPPREPRALEDVVQRMIEQNWDFTMLSKGEIHSEINYEPSWFKQCEKIDMNFDHERLDWVILVPAKPDEKEQSPDGTHYIYDGCHKTLVYAHRLLTDKDTYKPVRFLMVNPRCE